MLMIKIFNTNVIHFHQFKKKIFSHYFIVHYMPLNSFNWSNLLTLIFFSLTKLSYLYINWIPPHSSNVQVTCHLYSNLIGHLKVRPDRTTALLFRGDNNNLLQRERTTPTVQSLVFCSTQTILLIRKNGICHTCSH